MPAAAPKLSDEGLVEMLSLMQGADSVELKLTIPESAQRSAIEALGMDPLGAQVRMVYFFDTPELALESAGVVVRARRVARKGDDSVVKLRPVVPAELRAEVRDSPHVHGRGRRDARRLRLLGVAEGQAEDSRSSTSPTGARRCASSSPRSSGRSSPSTRRTASTSTT